MIVVAASDTGTYILQAAARPAERLVSHSKETPWLELDACVIRVSRGIVVPFAACPNRSKLDKIRFTRPVEQLTGHLEWDLHVARDVAHLVDQITRMYCAQRPIMLDVPLLEKVG